MRDFQVVFWRDGRAWLLDQRALPLVETWLAYDSAAAMAEGIRAMVVRGAPAIGCAAAYGLAVEAHRLAAHDTLADWPSALAPGVAALLASRPTAVNLAWALERLQQLIPVTAPAELPQRLLAEAHRIHAEDIAACRAMGQHGAALLPATPGRPITILTHCNAGALATAGYGTALGVIRAAVENGRSVRVMACETRPYLQGARLTAWELLQDGIPTTLITDGMSGHAMARGLIDAVVVGADRVAANGDAANKIGTYMHALAARQHNIPFLVAAPLSTIDRHTPDGRAIPIEERHADEVTHCQGQAVAAPGVQVFNPAFDVTPAQLITALVTERGAATPPSRQQIDKLFGDQPLQAPG